MRGLSASWALPWRRLTRGVSSQWEKGVRVRRLPGVSSLQQAAGSYMSKDSYMCLFNSPYLCPGCALPWRPLLERTFFTPSIHPGFGWYRTIAMSHMEQHTVSNRAPSTMSPDIVIGNPDELERKKRAIRGAGLCSLQVIADFDMTLTKYMVDGRRGQSTHALLNQGSSDYDRKRQELFDIYYPLEISPDIPVDEKAKLMETWWEKSHGLLVEGGLNVDNIRKSVEKGTVGFRENINDFFEILDVEGVPLLIFSAGLADIIEEVNSWLHGIPHVNEVIELLVIPIVEKENSGRGVDEEVMEILHQKLHRTFGNIRVVSNRMKFDKNGNLTGFIGKTIHVLNKNEHALEMAAPLRDGDGTVVAPHDNGASIVKGRRNVLLLGDHLGDLGMSDGVDYDNRISIGFLNENVDNWLEIYKQAFDIVLLNDGPLDSVVELVQELRSERK